MSLGVVLTIIFVVLKVINAIDWAWWQVLLPPIFFEVGLDVLLFVALGFAASRMGRKL